MIKNFMTEYPKVSVIIPCRNEEKFISKCLDSIIVQDYPKDKLEVLVVDGMSDDGTREILKKYAQQYSFIILLDNPKKIVPYAMNIGIKNAKGEIIMLMSAHTVYRNDYISKCVKYLLEYNVDNVGGILITLPGAESLVAKSFALALSHPFGVGNAYFRIGSKEPRLVDTVPFGCYRKEVFEKIGLFDENLVRNQDIEINLRLRRRGGKILLVPEIVSYYHARSNLKELFSQNFWNGFWVIYSLKFARLPFSIRHLVPFMFVLSLMGSLMASILFNQFVYLFVIIAGSYFMLNLFFSFKISWRKGIIYLFPIILSFATLHFSYGLGSIYGMLKLIISEVKKKVCLEI